MENKSGLDCGKTVAGMAHMADLLLYSAGLILAFLLDAVWRVRFYEKDRGKIRIIEHYHWGLGILLLEKIIRSEILLGLGTGLIIAEELQKHPFGYGSDHFRISTAVGLTLMLILLLLNLL